MIRRAWSLTNPPSTRPGVSIMLSVNPNLVRETNIGLGVSDWKTITIPNQMKEFLLYIPRLMMRKYRNIKRTWKALTGTTLSPIIEFTMEDFPTPPFPITRMVNVVTFYNKILRSIIL